MSRVIILDAAQADTVRGPSALDAAHILDPVALTDGRFILGEAVLYEPAFADHAALLGSCPVVDVADIAGLLPPDPED